MVEAMVSLQNSRSRGIHLCLFVGEAFPDGDGCPIPPQIILFLENLWDFSDSDEAIYLGLDELDLEDRGLD